MPVTPEENEQYRLFVSEKAREIGLFNYNPDDIIWHYTDGTGFLGILQSATIYATQVSSLNDRNETKYATDLFKKSVEELRAAKKDDEVARAFLNGVLEYTKDNPDAPTHGTSKFFVSCFSAEEDDLSQWDRYGKQNGYAIGFYARGFRRSPISSIYRVVYDRAAQEKVSKELAEATLRFFIEGLKGERLQDPQKWAEEFFLAWDEWIYKLAPLAKDPQWKAENEFRLVHKLDGSDFSRVRFQQKATMLGRYLPISTPQWVKHRTPRLPVAKIFIGPGNHSAFTRVSVLLLLEQLGYVNIPVEVTNISLQRP